LPIAGTECSDERRHVSISLQSTEAFDGLQDARRHPAQHHLSAAPALDVALHMTRATEETFGGVRRGQRSTQTRREVQQRHHVEGIERRTCQAASCAVVLATKRRLTALMLHQ
jgi:hypothetical protein